MKKSLSENAKNQNKPKALIIDDSYDFFQSVYPVLSRKLDIEYAPDGFTAFQLVKRFTFDIIVCDINMPMINGFTLMQEFQKKHLKIPFLLMSGDMNEKMTTDALHLGAYNVLEKPFEMRDMVDKVYKAIELHLQDENALDLDEQDRAYIYNTLKMHYYDVEKIMRIIESLKLDKKHIYNELDKKTATGKCMFDDVNWLKHSMYRSAV